MCWVRPSAVCRAQHQGPVTFIPVRLRKPTALWPFGAGCCPTLQVYQGDGVLLNVMAAVRRGATIRRGPPLSSWARQLESECVLQHLQ